MRRVTVGGNSDARTSGAKSETSSLRYSPRNCSNGSSSSRIRQRCQRVRWRLNRIRSALPKLQCIKLNDIIIWHDSSARVLLSQGWLVDIVMINQLITHTHVVIHEMPATQVGYMQFPCTWCHYDH